MKKPVRRRGVVRKLRKALMGLRPFVVEVMLLLAAHSVVELIVHALDNHLC